MGQAPLPPQSLTFTATGPDLGRRLDAVLAERLDVTRSQLLRAFDAELVTCNDEPARKGARLEEGDVISATLPTRPVLDLEPRPVDFTVIHEDEHLIVIDKPADLSVHPAEGQRMTTLVHGLLHRWPELSDSSGDHRPGIVHRLDRFTSGVLVVARDNRTHEALSRQFAERTVKKTYEALLDGRVEFDENLVDAPIARDPKARERMAVVEDGKEARTRIDVIRRYDRVTHVRCFPQQGRRHQIRVHCLSLGHRILCDVNYGGWRRLTPNTFQGRPPADDEPVWLDRLALHARHLELTHPVSGDRVVWSAPLPDDLSNLIRRLEDGIDR